MNFALVLETSVRNLCCRYRSSHMESLVMWPFLECMTNTQKEALHFKPQAYFVLTILQALANLGYSYEIFWKAYLK